VLTGNRLLTVDFDTGNIRISDFGLCAVWKHKGKTRLLSGRCGSLPYVAPEVIDVSFLPKLRTNA
jgi:serine/threonine protein kinase